jgi:hypothetical protein
MKRDDWLVEEVMKVLSESTLTPDQAGTSTRNGPFVSAGANGPHPVDAQKFKGELPDEEEKKHDSLHEQQNTLLADVNEILVGYYCAGGNWSLFDDASKVKNVLENRKGQISPEAYDDQDGRAQAQAEEAMKWARANGYEQSLTRVYWTARPGDLSRATGTPVSSKANPTDTLLRFGEDSFLGLSAKSTGGKKDIGFKNPGLGSLQKMLNADLVSPAAKLQGRLMSKLDFGDATTSKARKAYLKSIAGGRKMRTVPELEPYYDAGAKVLRKIRDALILKYLDMPIDDLKDHFLSAWIDAKETFPYYIKVTGMGTKGNYSAKVEDPLDNEKFRRLSSEHIELQESGANSIIVWAGEGDDASKLFRIRLKWESAPLVTSIKLSGDPA